MGFFFREGFTRIFHMAKECLEAECVMKTRENRGLSIIGIGLLSGEGGGGGGGGGGRRNSFPSTGSFWWVLKPEKKDNDSMVWFYSFTTRLLSREVHYLIDGQRRRRRERCAVLVSHCLIKAPHGRRARA